MGACDRPARGGGARIREKHAHGGALLRCTCTRVRESLSHVSHAWKNKDLACHKACHMVCHACHMGGSCVAPGRVKGGLEGEVGVGEPLAQGLAGRRLIAGGDDHAGLNGLAKVGGGVVAVAAVVAPAGELADMAEELIGFAGLLDAMGGAVFAIGGVEVHGGGGAIGP